MTSTATRTDRYGFPIRDCKRCGGSGHYSYNSMHGTMCYGCSGKGVQHTPKAAKAYGEWVTAVRQQQQPCVSDLEVGDEVRDYGSPKGSAFRTVVAIEITDQECGWSKTGADSKVYHYYRMVTFDDGTTQRLSANLCMRRRGTVDPAPYLAKAK